jgi:hypothetical protein
MTWAGHVARMGEKNTGFWLAKSKAPDSLINLGVDGVNENAF